MSPIRRKRSSKRAFVPSSRPEKIVISEGIVRIAAMKTPVTMQRANPPPFVANDLNVTFSAVEK